MWKIYKIDIDENDPETEVEFNALVDVPAHLKMFNAFDKNKAVELFVNEEQQMVTGVMISADSPIYRRDKQLGEHFVIFDAAAIKKMWLRYNQKGYSNRVNQQHDSSKVINGIFMVSQWIVDGPEGLGVPEKLKGQGIRSGSWIATYKITDPEIWKKVKDGTFNGFSIEGLFIKYPAKVKSYGGDEMSKRDLIYSYKKYQKEA